MKKTFYSIIAGATWLASMLSVVACSSEEEQALSDGRVPLEVEIVGVQDTRTIIDGLVPQKDLFYGMSGLDRTPVKRIAQRIGITSASWTRR